MSPAANTSTPSRRWRGLRTDSSSPSAPSTPSACATRRAGATRWRSRPQVRDGEEVAVLKDSSSPLPSQKAVGRGCFVWTTWTKTYIKTNLCNRSLIMCRLSLSMTLKYMPSGPPGSYTLQFLTFCLPQAASSTWRGPATALRSPAPAGTATSSSDTSSNVTSSGRTTKPPSSAGRPSPLGADPCV